MRKAALLLLVALAAAGADSAGRPTIFIKGDGPGAYEARRRALKKAKCFTVATKESEADMVLVVTETRENEFRGNHIQKSNAVGVLYSQDGRQLWQERSVLGPGMIVLRLNDSVCRSQKPKEKGR